MGFPQSLKVLVVSFLILGLIQGIAKHKPPAVGNSPVPESKLIAISQSSHHPFSNIIYLFSFSLGILGFLRNT